eukprot:TRINITY_DN10559_c0_g1_i2.p2 TRINITY_DN10559_c0_g1~~TRINITY_DN10559_c0_g1_i2.p2  ORF type:complete len:218 (+),score=42.72 TRINITY_DN10559_c0_g1_i2:62-715(+)
MAGASGQPGSPDAAAPQALHRGAAAAGFAGLAWVAAVVPFAVPVALRRRGRPLGAPFVATRRPQVEALCESVLPRHAARLGTPLSALTFCDLGSGDGRVVIAAARRGMRAQGFEINPVLLAWSRASAAAAGWGVWRRTRFSMRSFWGVNLAHCDVVHVYGLDDIMEPLAEKLEQELRPGSLVVSNTFAMPRSWQRLEGESGGGMLVYRVAEKGATLS